MRICHVITRLIVGGAQENTLLSCEGLHARGHDVLLLSGPTTGPEGSLVDRARTGGYEFDEIDALVRPVRPARDVQALFALQRCFERWRPDVVHTHSSKAGVLGRRAAHRTRVPVTVHTIHGMSFNRTQSWPIRTAYTWAERWCAEWCHAIVCVADAMREQALAAGIGRPEQYVTIRSGMDTAQFDPAHPRGHSDPHAVRSEWGFDPQHVVVGTVARLFYNKGYEQLLEVMSRAAAADPRLRFVWIGDGAARQDYEAELRSRNLRNRTVLTGLVPPADMPKLLSGIDILAHTSQWEGLPRAVVQALLMEKPVVSFAIDGAPEVVIPGTTGELAPLNDTAAFAQCLLRLAADPNRRAELGQAGRRLCLQMFDHHRMVDGLEELYSRLKDYRGCPD